MKHVLSVSNLLTQYSQHWTFDFQRSSCYLSSHAPSSTSTLRFASHHNRVIMTSRYWTETKQ